MSSADSILSQQHRCLHCGQVMAEDLPVIVGGEDSEIFCCTGCRAVYFLLQESGLGSYYSLLEKENEGSRFAQRVGDGHEGRYRYVNDPVFQEKNVQVLDSGYAEVCFYAEGMHCSACIWLLEKLPRLEPGVFESRVDFARSTVRITYDPQRKLSHIAQTISRLGYPVHPYEANAAKILRENESRQLLLKIGVAGLAAGNTMLLAVSLYQGIFTGIEDRYRDFFEWISFLLCLPVVTFSALPFYRAAFGGLRIGQLHIDLPISIGILAGFGLSVANTFFRLGEGVYYDSISMLVFLLLVGRFVQRRAIVRSLELNESRVGFLPVSATRRNACDREEQVYVDSLAIGDRIVIGRGEILAADGVIAKGEGEVDLSMLTGESLPNPVSQGERVFAGTKLLAGSLEVQVEKKFHDSRIGKLIRQMREEFSEPILTQQFVDRLGKRFVVSVLGIAVVNFGVWSFFVGLLRAIDTTLSLLIITCPCALGLATPIMTALAVEGALRKGILIQKGSVLELIPRITTFFFDKTGTLTRGNPSLTGCLSFSERGMHQREPREVESCARSRIMSLESGSLHPIAAAFESVFPVGDRPELLEHRDVPGAGVSGRLADGTSILLGSLSYLKACGIPFEKEWDSELERWAEGRTLVGYAERGSLRYCFRFDDPLRKEAFELIEKVRKTGARVLILSGDRRAVVEKVARSLHLSDCEVHGECSPEEKARIVQEHSRKPGVISAMVGDGANDLAALQAAAVGFGLRGGVESCLGAVDVFIPTGEVQLVSRCIDGADQTMKRIFLCLRGALIYNFVGGALAVSGFASPLFAAVLMPLSSLSVVAYAWFGREFSDLGENAGLS